MNCNAYHAGSATTPVYLRLAVSALCLLALLAAAALPASANTVTFKYTCTNCQPTLQLATFVGRLASDTNTIATVQSDVPGYTNPVPISGGLLALESSPATYVDCPGPSCGAAFGIRGGSAAIVGSVFGLSPGSTLLTAYFGAGAGDNFITQTVEDFVGATTVLYVNPAILANLGLPSSTNVGSGKVELYWEWNPNNFNWDGTITVTFTPVGEAAE
jgi:hypothetical protein